MRSLVWFREGDLRVEDHAPLWEACQGDEVIPVFVAEPPVVVPPGNAFRDRFVQRALGALQDHLRRLGSRLVAVPGPCEETLPRWAKAWQVDQVLVQRRGTPAGRAQDARIEARLTDAGIPWRGFEGETLWFPDQLQGPSGQGFRVFTAFQRAALRLGGIGAPLPVPERVPPLPARFPQADEAPVALPVLESPRVRLDHFLETGLSDYPWARDRMDLDGTSRLSADLAVGTLSARTLWQAVSGQGGGGSEKFLSELLWREFAHHWLWRRPDLLTSPFQPGFEGFPWREDPESWAAWVHGRTGYPVVDAAARQLLQTGHVHNRARMVVASFLAKHLLLDFRQGEAHYLAHLEDADPANNDLGWQWSAGCGCDAQPWFRVFNPVLQGRRFDPHGDYVRQWVPELQGLPVPWIHQPHQAPPGVLRTAGVVLGETYPWPVVDHAMARNRFLQHAKAHLGRRAFES